MKLIKLVICTPLLIAYLLATLFLFPFWYVPALVWGIGGLILCAFHIFQPFRAFIKVLNFWAKPVEFLIRWSGLEPVIMEWLKKKGPDWKRQWEKKVAEANPDSPKDPAG